MKINESTALLTSRVLLVPYSKHHVPEYHEWMTDEELQQATASEPLTLEEEYSMQRSWRTDNDKLTFIVCLPPDGTRNHILRGKEDASSRMIGDVNLFLVEDDEAGEPDGKGTMPLIGELEIMIARKDLHRKGYGRATLFAFLWYIRENLSGLFEKYTRGREVSCKAELRYLRVKIGSQNARSISLFEGVGFEKESEEPNYFGEIELRLPLAKLSSRDLGDLEEFGAIRVLAYTSEP